MAESVKKDFLKGFNDLKGRINFKKSGNDTSKTIEKEEPFPMPAPTSPVIGDDDTQNLLMDQLASMAQDLASVRMAHEEQKQALAALTGERDALAAENEKLAKQYKSVKEQVAFANVDKTQVQLKQYKSDKEGLEEELTRSRQKLEKFQTTLAEVSGQLHKALDERSQLYKDKKEQENDSNMIKESLTQATQSIQQLNEDKEAAAATIARHQAALNGRVEEMEGAHTKAIENLQSSFEKTSNEGKEEVDKLRTERNRHKKRADGLAKDVKKLMKQHDTLQAKISGESELEAANARLTEELERTRKGLSNALEALSDSMMSSSDRQPDGHSGHNDHNDGGLP